MLEAFGVDPTEYEGRADEIRPDLIERLREMGQQAGLDFDELEDEQLMMDVHYSFFPNITFNISPGHFWLFRARPHPTDPDRMYWDYFNYDRIPKGAEPPPEGSVSPNALSRPFPRPVGSAPKPRRSWYPSISGSFGNGAPRVPSSRASR